MSRRENSALGNGVGSGVSELESRLLKTGAERLALLGKHAERLLPAYTRQSKGSCRRQRAQQERPKMDVA